MLSFLFNFIKNNKNQTPFDKNYKNGYKNLWINNLKNYTP